MATQFAIDPTLLGDSLKVEKTENEVEMAIPPTEVEADGMGDLFGDEDAEIVTHSKEEEEGKAGSPPADESLTEQELQHRRDMEYGEDDENEPEEIHLREAAVSIPNIPRPQTSDGNHWVFRMPNFMKLDSRPFHPQTYVGPEQTEEETRQTRNLRERSVGIKLQVENTIRWRWYKDNRGNDIKESNSRIIRWSDGSKTLLLGKELFEIHESIDTSATISRQALGPSRNSTVKPSGDSKLRAKGLTYLVAQHARSAILQTEASITGTMTMRPIGMQSETHQMLVRAVSQKHNKVARLRMAPDPVRDPEREKLELLKIQAKKPRKKRDRDADDLGGNAGRKRSYGRRQTERLYSDEEDEEPDRYSDEDSDTATPKRARFDKKDKDKETGDYQTDDFLVSDEEEGEGGDDDMEIDEATPKRKKSNREDVDAAKDALDEMDERIEQQEAKRRKKRGTSSAEPGDSQGTKGDEAGEEEEREVESEERDAEDEDDSQVRKAGTGTRRKLVVDEDDDDE